jgi:hypothetical protein
MVSAIRLLGRPIKKVAVLVDLKLRHKKNAISLEQMLLTADLKYHQFMKQKTDFLADIDILKANAIQKIILLTIFEKILNFAIILSEENTNPVKYL